MPLSTSSCEWPDNSSGVAFSCRVLVGIPAFVNASSGLHSLPFNRDCARLYLLTESELAGLDFM